MGFIPEKMDVQTNGIICTRGCPQNLLLQVASVHQEARMDHLPDSVDEEIETWKSQGGGLQRS